MDLPNGKGQFANIEQTAEQQDKMISLHRSMYERSLLNPFQILAPPNLDTQPNFPNRIVLTQSPQQVYIEVPRKALYFLFKQILISWPKNLAGGLPGPQLEITIDGLDKKHQNSSINVQNFTSPGTQPDPSTASASNYFGAYKWNTLFPNMGVFKLTIFGFDGTNPAHVDIAIIGRAMVDRKLVKGF